MEVPQVDSDGGSKQASSFVQEFTLRWEPHDARVSESMLKFWERRLFLDVSLMASNSKTIQAHRLVLCACSPLFEALLSGDEMAKHSHPMLCFNQIDYEHLHSLVEFMYRGTMTVTQETLPLIMKSAKILRIHGLTLDNEQMDSPPESTSGSDKLDPTPSRKRRKIAAAPVIPSIEESAIMDPSPSAATPDHSMAALLSVLAANKSSPGPSPLRPRLVWDPAHLECLERWYFTETRYPTVSQSTAYANQLNAISVSVNADPKSKKVGVVTAQNVSHWFQNRRRKDNHPEIEEKRSRRGQKKGGSRKQVKSEVNEGDPMTTNGLALDLTRQINNNNYNQSENEDQEDEEDADESNYVE